MRGFLYFILWSVIMIVIAKLGSLNTSPDSFPINPYYYYLGIFALAGILTKIDDMHCK